MRRVIPKIITLLVIGIGIYFFFALQLNQYFTLDFIKSKQSEFNNYYVNHKGLTIGIYMVIYVISTALSLPGATILTLLAGALFGIGLGTLIVSFASSIGATGAFLVARFLLRDSIEGKFSKQLKNINQGIAKEGAFYLFALRLVPLFPFFVINLVMGLTRIKIFTFYWVSQVGMLLGTVVYVNAGTQLAKIDSVGDIASPSLLLSFALLGVIPIISKKTLGTMKAKKAFKGYKKPKSYEYNQVVIGAGAAGLVTSYIAAAVKAKVALIEKHKMGGDCLNTGCVPSKALIRSAKMLSYISRSKEFGIFEAHANFNFSDIMERIQRVIKKIEPHDSVERYSSLGVDCIQGEAKIKSPFEVEVNGRTLTTKSIVIATGAGPLIPPIAGLDKVKYWTTDTIWELREKPSCLLILGGGPIGSELAQSFQRLGIQVTLVEMGPQILIREDDDASQFVIDRFKKEGVDLRTGHKAKEFKILEKRKVLICDTQKGKTEIEFDEVLLALGRKARVEGFGLEELGVQINPKGTVDSNELLQTNIPNIFVCGDAVGPFQFTHVAAHQAWYASVNSLFGHLKSFKVDYSVIPWCTYTDPEIARVGLNEKEAKRENIPYEITTYGIDDLDRAIADEEDHGVVKVLTEPGKDKILGVTIVGNHAGDYISEFVLAMKYGIGLSKILGTIHIYPTLAEANKYVAGNWKKAHAPESALKWIERYHTWRRG